MASILPLARQYPALKVQGQFPVIASIQLRPVSTLLREAAVSRLSSLLEPIVSEQHLHGRYLPYG
jgi:hypothetical protein